MQERERERKKEIAREREKKVLKEEIFVCSLECICDKLIDVLSVCGWRDGENGEEKERRNSREKKRKRREKDAKYALSGKDILKEMTFRQESSVSLSFLHSLLSLLLSLSYFFLFSFRKTPYEERERDGI